MSRARIRAADPVSLAVACSHCGRPPLTRRKDPNGEDTRTHLVRVHAGLAAQERSNA